MAMSYLFRSTLIAFVSYDKLSRVYVHGCFFFDLDPTQFLDLFELCFPVLKTEWEELDVAVEVSLKEV